MQRPRVALVHDWLTGFAGGEQVLLAFHRVYPEAPIFTSLYNAVKVPQFHQAEVIPSRLQQIPGILKKDKLAIPLMPAAFESLDLKGFDIIISSGAFSKGVITHPGQYHINYCHTPIRYIWNLGGDTRNKGKWDSWLREREAHKLRIWDVVSSERVDTFLANSTTVQARIAKIYRRDSLVVHPPVAVEQYTVTESNEGFYLTVGRLVSYKNSELIIRSFMANGRSLKVVGTGPEEVWLRRLASAHPNIEFLGRVSDQERDQLYSKTRAFVFAAEEDFGIVPVEAQACGKPVICYATGGQTDVVEEGITGIYFSYLSIPSLTEAIEKCEKMTFDAKIIRKAAERFSESNFIKAIENVVNSHTGRAVIH